MRSRITRSIRRKADAELILQQLADAAHAAVAEVVDIVRVADAVGKAVEVVYRGEYIVNNDMLWNKHVDILEDSFLRERRRSTAA